MIWQTFLQNLVFTSIFSFELLLLAESTYLILMSCCYGNHDLYHASNKVDINSILGTDFVSSFNMTSQIIFQLKLEIYLGKFRVNCHLKYFCCIIFFLYFSVHRYVKHIKRCRVYSSFRSFKQHLRSLRHKNGVQIWWQTVKQ